MIKIHFEAESWSVLREQIQEFAVSHLHAKFGDLKLEHGQVGGVSDTTLPAAEPAPKTRGKKSAPKVEVEPVKVETKVEQTTAAAPSSPSHTLDECTAALQKVWDKHGMDKSLECLSRFGAKRARELLPESYAPFIALCEETAK